MPESSGIPQSDEPIRKLPSGLEIVRRQKHEYKDLSAYSPEQQARLTNKEFGSKFTADWDAERIADFIEEQLALLGWNLETNKAETVVRTTMITGISFGRPVRAIKIRLYGRYVHAFPVKE